MVNQCFVCSGQIRTTRTSQNSKEIENSILLYQILEIQHHLENDVNKFSEINYCSVCESRILGIRVMLEELEKLEKRVLDEKYLIEVQLKENSSSGNSTDQLRSEIVTELRSTSVQFMLEKIRTKQVGRKLRPGPRHVRLMENVTIPKIRTPSIEGVEPNCVTINNVQNEMSCPSTATEGNSEFSQCKPSGSRHSCKVGISFSPEERFPIESHDSHDMNIQSEDTNSKAVIENPDTSYFNEPEISWVDNTEEYDVKYEIETTDQSEISNDQESDVLTLTNGMLNPILITPNMPVEMGSVHYDSVEESEEYEVKLPQGHQADGPPNVEVSMYETSSSSNQLTFHNRLQTNFPLDSSTTSESKYRHGHRRNATKSQNKNRSSHDRPSHRSKKCEECGKVLSCYKTWKYHVLSLHRGLNQFKCPVCNYACPRRANLKIHMMSHSDIRNFKCSICEKSFKYKGGLKKHFKLHL